MCVALGESDKQVERSNMQPSYAAAEYFGVRQTRIRASIVSFPK